MTFVTFVGKDRNSLCILIGSVSLTNNVVGNKNTENNRFLTNLVCREMNFVPPKGPGAENICLHVHRCLRNV